MKYIRNFSNLSAAKNSILYSPTVIKISENNLSKVFYKDLKELDVEMIVSTKSTNLDNVIIIKKTNNFILSESKLNSGAVYA